MSEETHGHHAAGDPSDTPVFSAEELKALRDADVQAAKSVVLLMVGVFTMGLILYSIVALSIL